MIRKDRTPQSREKNRRLKTQEQLSLEVSSHELDYKGEVREVYKEEV